MHSTIDEIRFAAMGCAAHVVLVDAPRGALEHAVSRIEQLESRWSRFRDSSEISRLNRHHDVPVVVSRDTYCLLEHAIFASVRTDGRYDPTLLDVMLAIGYDRDFAAVRATPGAVQGVDHRPNGCSKIRLDPHVRAITLPAGIRIDPGGIGKGLAADLVVAELRAAGAGGALVNLGGDVAIDGTPPDEHGWIVGIEDPFDPARHLARVTVEAGGVCTSSRFRRSWTTRDGRPVHHLIDPRTGAPATGDVVAITVVAGAAWWAEAATKALFIGTRTCEPRDSFEGVHALIVTETREIRLLGNHAVFDLCED